MARPRQPRNNVTRLLDGRGIDYVAHSYEAERHSATEVAEMIGLPPIQVFKTLVTLSDTPRAKPVLAIVPGPAELDLKKLAAAVGEKRMHMATQREAERLTGLQVGGISALALLNKGFRPLIDLTARQFGRIAVSAGQRGLNVELPVADLVEIIGAEWAELV